MKKLFKILTCVMLLAGTLSTPVFANGQIPTSTIEEIPAVTTPTTPTNSENLDYVGKTEDDMLQYSNIVLGDSAGVTTAEISQKVIRKAYEVADIFRAVAIPIVLASFVVSIISAIWGAISARKTVVPGLLGMLFCGVGFALILYAPQILMFFGRWLWS